MLSVREPQPSPPELLTQHSVLLQQIVDDLLLAAVEPTDNSQYPELQDERVHCRERSRLDRASTQATKRSSRPRDFLGPSFGTLRGRPPRHPSFRCAQRRGPGVGAQGIQKCPPKDTARPAGFEPATNGLEGHRSIQLRVCPHPGRRMCAERLTGTSVHLRPASPLAVLALAGCGRRGKCALGARSRRGIVESLLRTELSSPSRYTALQG